MTKTNIATENQTASQIASGPNMTAQALARQSGTVASVLEMRERLEALANEREAWEASVYTRSNEMLYGLIQKCYQLYVELTDGKAGSDSKKVGFKDYINTKGYVFKSSTPLTGKIIRCVFGDKDRRRLSTYHTVLRVIVADKWLVTDVCTKIAEYGGVQEISLGRKAGSLTPKEKALEARDAVLGINLATVSSDKIAAQNNPEKIGEQAVAVVTQNSDGSYTVHCVVHGDGVVNAALASYFVANKDEIAKQKQRAATTKAVATQDELIAKAAAVANGADVEIAA